MADTSQYYMPDDALQRVQQKLNQMRLAGQSVSPQDVTSMYQAELNAIAQQASTTRAQNIQQQQFDTSTQVGEQEFAANRALTKEQLQGQNTAGFVQAGATLGSAALLGKDSLGNIKGIYDTVSKPVKTAYDYLMNKPATPTTPVSVDPSGNANPFSTTSSPATIGPSTDVTATGGNGVTSGANTPATYNWLNSTQPEQSFSMTPVSDGAVSGAGVTPSTTAIPPYMTETAAPAAASTAATGTSVADVGASTIGNTLTDPAMVSAASTTPAGIGLSSYAPPVAAGLVGGYLGGKFGDWAGEQLGIGGKNEREIGGGILGGAATGAAIGSIVPGVGTVVGGLVGGIVGGAEEAYNSVSDAVGTVICTELHRQGYIDDAIYATESRYGSTLAPECMIGYRKWAWPLVKKMRKSKLVTYITYIIVRPVMQEMAHRVDNDYHSSFIGSLMLLIGKPLCYVIGCLSKTTEVIYG